MANSTKTVTLTRGSTKSKTSTYSTERPPNAEREAGATAYIDTRGFHRQCEGLGVGPGRKPMTSRAHRDDDCYLPPCPRTGSWKS